MAPRKKSNKGGGKKKAAPKTLRRSRRLRKKSPCPGLSWPIRRKATRRLNQCGALPKRSNCKVKRKKKPSRRNCGNHYYRRFVSHVGKRIRNNKNLCKLNMNVIAQAASCWRCLSEEQKEDFKRSVDSKRSCSRPCSSTGSSSNSQNPPPNSSSGNCNCNCTQSNDTTQRFFNHGWEPGDDNTNTKPFP